ncbi:unnamed protein product, partial [Didymodactylos carnosus]
MEIPDTSLFPNKLKIMDKNVCNNTDKSMTNIVHDSSISEKKLEQNLIDNKSQIIKSTVLSEIRQNITLGQVQKEQRQVKFFDENNKTQSNNMKGNASIVKQTRNFSNSKIRLRRLQSNLFSSNKLMRTINDEMISSNLHQIPTLKPSSKSSVAHRIELLKQAMKTDQRVEQVEFRDWKHSKKLVEKQTHDKETLGENENNKENKQKLLSKHTQTLHQSEQIEQLVTPQILSDLTEKE